MPSLHSPRATWKRHASGLRPLRDATDVTTGGTDKYGEKELLSVLAAVQSKGEVRWVSPGYVG